MKKTITFIIRSMTKEIGRGMTRYGLTIKDVDFTHASNDAVLHLTTVSKSHRQVNSRVTLDSSV